MLLRHHLKKGFRDVPLRVEGYATEHQDRNDEVRHIGFKVKARYAGPDPKPNTAAELYEFIFETEKEYLELLERAKAFEPRFADPNRLPPIVGEADLDEADEEED